jgi:hypothetical protein
MKDLMTVDQRMKQRDHGPVLLISTGRLPGTTSADSRPSSEAEFATNAEALQAARGMWSSLRHQFPFIADKTTRQPIFDRDELRDTIGVLTTATDTNGPDR